MPLFPVTAGFLALTLINGPITGGAAGNTMATPDLSITAHLPDRSTFYKTDLDMRFFPGLVTYVSVGLFHLFACLTVITLMIRQIFQFSPEVRRQSLLVLTATIALLVVVNVVGRLPAMSGALTLTYRNICTVVLAGGVVPHLLPETCTSKGISAFAWLALLPYLFGLLAAATAAAVTSTTTRPIIASDDIEQELERRARLLEQTFRATAFVLVTSVITMMLFYQLPLNLIDEPQAQTLMSQYSNSLSLFWGVIFTLTLVAVFAPASLMIRQHLRELQVDATLPDVLISERMRERLLTIISTLAPLLVGASGSIVEAISAAL